MTEPDTTLSDSCRRRLDEHLDAIERALLQTTASRESRRSVVEMVESQVIEMCRNELSEQASDEDISTLFDKLDPPEMYAEAFERVPSEPGVLSRRKRRFPISKHAIASIILLALPLPVGLLSMTATELLPLFFASLVGAVLVSPALSVMALLEVSRKKLIGRQLALISLYVSPVATVNVIAFLIPALIGRVAIVICVGLTLIALNVGIVWLVRNSLAKWLPSLARNGNRMHDAPIVANSVAGAS